MADEKKKEPKPEKADKLFAEKRNRVDDFDFGEQTAAVFDDMLNRSVPFYGEIQRMVAELSVDFAKQGTVIYDFGCSTCNTFLKINERLSPDLDVRFVGFDNSQEMLDKAGQKLKELGFSREYELRCQDIDKGVNVENASVCLLLLTLQFIRPLYRERLIKSIFDGLNVDGCLILVEKVLGESSTFNRLFINHYYEMKRRHGYSDLEISQKREALENVLVPYRLQENLELLGRVGFRNLDVFFKWYNFCGILAMK